MQKEKLYFHYFPFFSEEIDTLQHLFSLKPNILSYFVQWPALLKFSKYQRSIVSLHWVLRKYFEFLYIIHQNGMLYKVLYSKHQTSIVSLYCFLRKYFPWLYIIQQNLNIAFYILHMYAIMASLSSTLLPHKRLFQHEIYGVIEISCFLYSISLFSNIKPMHDNKRRVVLLFKLRWKDWKQMFCRSLSKIKLYVVEECS